VKIGCSKYVEEINSMGKLSKGNLKNLRSVIESFCIQNFDIKDNSFKNYYFGR
jgi:hypothetical protein